MGRADYLQVALLAGLALAAVASVAGAGGFAGTGKTDFTGYKDCVFLENRTTRVILGPHCGGRVLGYSYRGRQAIPLDPRQDGYTFAPDKPWTDVYGGRFDIGPEAVTPGHTDLWYGLWTAEITGPRAARMTSKKDSKLGVQLVRDFVLDERTSHLRCTQTIRNLSAETRRLCHWSRTFGLGDGICLVPLNPHSRFPRGFITYGPGAAMNYSPPDDPNMRVRDGFLEIRGTPPHAKFGLDSEAGWFAYLMTNDTMFVKRFPVYPDRVYNEMAAITVSIYYFPDEAAGPRKPGDVAFCELEPIGPREVLEPGQSSSFAEEWWLLPRRFPQDRNADIKAVVEQVEKETRR